MKLRIKGNTIRFRLTISDVATFAENHYISESTSFGSKLFKYGMKIIDHGEKIKAEFSDEGIFVLIPSPISKNWVESTLVGLSEDISFETGPNLFILIEKDFKCLDETSEDQSDNYENPLAGKNQ